MRASTLPNLAPPLHNTRESFAVTRTLLYAACVAALMGVLMG